MPVHACLLCVSQKTGHIIHIEPRNNGGICAEGMRQARWNRNGFECGRGVVKDKVCVRSGTQRGMVFFFKAHLCDSVGERKKRSKKQPRVHTYISSEPALSANHEKVFIIKS